jgi:hypothetical protein
MTYTDLPAEILADIASHLDIPSAIALAQTSSFSLQAAESRIWRDIKIDHIDRFTYLKSSEEDKNQEKDGKVEKCYQPYITLIDLRPWRSSMIRSLVVEPQFTPAPELSQLLSLIAGGLRHLKITYPSGLLVPSGPLVLISKMVEEIRMPALESLEVDIGCNGGCLGNLLRGSRGLKRLIVRGPETLGGVTASAMSLGMGGIKPPFDKNRIVEVEFDIPDILQLEYLSIDRMDSTVLPPLAKIVANSPRLHTAILRDPLSAWFPFPSPVLPSNTLPTRLDDPLLPSLSNNTSIKSLEIPSTCLKPMEDIIADKAGFRNIIDLTILWEFPHLHACSGGNGKDVNTQSEIMIPNLPNLKNCIFTLRTHQCDPNAEPYSIYRGYIFDLSINAIKRHALLSNFDSTPLLESIQLKDMYGSSIKAGGSHPRCETEFDGALITRYRGDDGELLVVLRHRVAHSCGWEEYGVYEGREVPRAVLDGVMSVCGFSGRARQLIKPGWAEMNEEAWSVLKHWATLS